MRHPSYVQRADDYVRLRFRTLFLGAADLIAPPTDYGIFAAQFLLFLIPAVSVDWDVSILSAEECDYWRLRFDFDSDFQVKDWDVGGVARDVNVEQTPVDISPDPTGKWQFGSLPIQGLIAGQVEAIFRKQSLWFDEKPPDFFSLGTPGIASPLVYAFKWGSPPLALDPGGGAAATLDANLGLQIEATGFWRDSSRKKRFS